MVGTTSGRATNETSLEVAGDSATGRTASMRCLVHEVSGDLLVTLQIPRHQVESLKPEARRMMNQVQQSLALAGAGFTRALEMAGNPITIADRLALLADVARVQGW